MKVCPACDNAFDAPDWLCPACGHRPAERDGVVCLAPEEAEPDGGYDPARYAQLADREARSFWFRARNRLWGRLEDWASPLCLHLGWRSDLTVEEALGDAPLDVVDVFSFRRIDLWKTVCCRRR